MKNRDAMSRAEFAAEYESAYPKDGMNEAFNANPVELKAWREAVVNHYFDGAKHRGPYDRMKVRNVLEAAFAAAFRVARQWKPIVMVAA